jgi:hypothetical protein
LEEYNFASKFTTIKENVRLCTITIGKNEKNEKNVMQNKN